MTVRTFKQQGAVFAPNNSNVNLVAKIDGQEVFSGTVPVNTAPFPIKGWTDDVVDLFSWEAAVDFEGEKQLEISITGGTLLLRDTVANYYKISYPETAPGVYPPPESSGPDTYGFLYAETYNSEGVLSDPLTNVKIDGVVQFSRPQDGPLGQWAWRVESGSTITATVNVLAGM